ncbi:MAG: hypothetical protein R3E97_24990 [Candidatus Eisenbacteria bacterium]
MKKRTANSRLAAAGKQRFVEIPISHGLEECIAANVGAKTASSASSNPSGGSSHAKDSRMVSWLRVLSLSD